ncbi:Scarecrow-like protein 3 [Vitis vinifera]|uniref:Scarecrow-like protein 3 n=1 Tax=Vitis vinifera TaxID=29760 RepID=A0A438CYA1_VITVI|nr:Scarecrow-like protein 3 [Vitis vinifera]
MAPMDERSSSVTSSPLQLFSMMSPSPSLGSPYPWLRELKSEERGLCLIHLLLTCANHVASGSLENVNIALEQISQLASADGDTMQRIAAYFTEALADRILKTWSGLHKALNSTRISFPSEDILALSARPEGPPHLRITGIHPQKEVLEQMAHRLTEEAEKLDIPFQFNPIVSKLENLDFEKLREKIPTSIKEFKWGSIAKSPAIEPNHIGSPKMDGFLNALWGLTPKLMNIYREIEGGEDAFGEEIKNIIACEGVERKERHEKLEKWIQRLDSAGFQSMPLSYYCMLQAKRLLQGYGCDGYRIKEENGCAVICCQDRPLFSVSAWRNRK